MTTPDNGRSVWRILEGDCRIRLAELEPGSVQTCITSPPYFGLRDYGTGQWEGGDPACEHRHDTAHQQQGVTSLRAGRSNVEAQRNENFRDVCPCGARRVDCQVGMEATPDEYVAALVEVFREVRRVLRDDGTVWLNLGSSYASSSTYNTENTLHTVNGWKQDGPRRPNAYVRGSDPNMNDTVSLGSGSRNQDTDASGMAWVNYTSRLKPKDMIPIPWMVAMALQADGWYLRSDIIWSKPNPMPESVTDRPTKAHEYLFLLSKGPRYFYDADAIREAGVEPERQRADRVGGANGHVVRHSKGAVMGASANRNRRSVWTVATQPYPGAHFATFPPKLIEPCILAGTSPKACGECGAPWRRRVSVTADGPGIECPQDRNGWEARRAPRGGVNEASVAASRLHGQYHNVQRETVGWESSCDHNDDTGRCIVLDPFAGSGTTGLVALRHGRSFVGIEANPDYVELARWRIRDDAPLLNTYAEVA